MRKFLAIVAFAFTLGAVLVPGLWFASIGGLESARQLFIPIACTSPKIFRWKLGTGFPVGRHLVMTAKHIDCHEAFGEEAVTEISDDGGTHWVQVLDDNNQPHGSLDVRIYFMPELYFKHVAKLRAPVLGENTSGYGVAFGEMADFGKVIKLVDGVAYTSAPAVGGMSGSAIVGDDEAVIGMAVEGEPATIGPGIISMIPSSGPDGPTLEKLLESYKDHFKR